MSRSCLYVASVLVVLAAGPAAADTVADQLIAQLTEQGFTRFRVSQTWLGRTRILAEGDGLTREIIVNPRTGEILRDFSAQADGDATAPELLSPRIGGTGDDSDAAAPQSDAQPDRGDTGGDPTVEDDPGGDDDTSGGDDDPAVDDAAGGDDDASGGDDDASGSDDGSRGDDAGPDDGHDGSDGSDDGSDESDGGDDDGGESGGSDDGSDDG